MPATTHFSAVAVTYARAILELANEQGAQEQVAQELADLKTVFDSDPNFALFLRDPAIGAAERQRVIDSVLRPQVLPLVANFLCVMNEHGRLGIFGEIAEAFRDLLDKQLGKVNVEVTVAQQLSDEQLEQVRLKVSEALKKTAIVQQRVDDSIIGGLVLKVEDKLIDASVKTQLGMIKEQLLARRPK